MNASPDPTSIDTDAGHRVYTSWSLPLYDLVVHGFSNRFLWNCRTATLQAWFDRHVTDRHLDIGVGTGFFLDRSQRLNSASQITLLDANQNCLNASSKRIARLQPTTVQANLAQPFPSTLRRFRSASLMYVLHCLPGEKSFRGEVIHRVAATLEPGGILFGATILGEPCPKGRLGRRVMASYNRRGIFGNQNDSLDSLQKALSDELRAVEIVTEGSVAMFAGSVS
ncbi:class I SAM-dependent methyltransferase [Bremerella sp. JC817]|uniref:class I SAM-dependent methyltransferase n=1 Tax=Bremerella sp. JC817 TaxID=3231756 RepID=UPI003459735F